MSSPPKFPEPVPELSQLVGLAFLSPIAGYLRHVNANEFRLTLHRTVVRNDEVYFQQLTPYLTEGGTTTGAGRLFPLDTGIVGASFDTQSILRTRFVQDVAVFEQALLKSMRNSGDPSSLSDMKARSWLSIPFLGSGQPPLVLFADSTKHGFFSADEVVTSINAMCIEFGRLLDALALHPYGSTRNHELAGVAAATGGPRVYGDLHETFGEAPPTLKNLQTFNFEAGPP